MQILRRPHLLASRFVLAGVLATTSGCYRTSEGTYELQLRGAVTARIEGKVLAGYDDYIQSGMGRHYYVTLVFPPTLSALPHYGKGAFMLGSLKMPSAGRYDVLRMINEWKTRGSVFVSLTGAIATPMWEPGSGTVRIERESSFGNGISGTFDVKLVSAPGLSDTLFVTGRFKTH